MRTEQAVEPFRKVEEDAKNAAQSLAQQLPVWPWINATKGLSANGLAIIVGEAERVVSGGDKLGQGFG